MGGSGRIVAYQQGVLHVNSLQRVLLIAAGLASLGLNASAEDRSIDGTGNYVSNPTRGAANTPMIRFGYTSQFKDSTGAMLTDADRANARDISNAIFAQTESRPSARNLSDFVWAWGQFVSHDTDLATTSNGAASNGYAPIAINSPTDPLGPNPIPFVRTNYVNVAQPRGGGTRLPVNEVTSYLDASTVYGSSAERAAALRTNGGAGAKLLTGANNLLPYNSAGLPVENNGPLPNTQMFLAGDIRANENSLLTSLHTVFTREHNRLVDVIAAQQPALSEEQQYQLARKIVGAEVQAITYKEFLPALLGTSPSVPRAEQYNYSGITAEITTAFAQAGFRYGHSTVSSQLQLVNDSGTNAGSLAVRNAFFNPTIIGNDPGKVDQLLKGAATQVSEEVDTLVVDELRNFLFGPPGAGGLDLAALNIQRGRDVGLPNYLQLLQSRQWSGLPVNFSGITSDPALAQALSEIYGGNMNNIDVWVGMLAEDHVAGAGVGRSLKREIEDQFRRLRDGDRLFYRANAAGLYTGGVLNPEIAAIIDLDHLRLSDLLAANTAISSFQQNVFFIPGTGDFNGDGNVDAADYSVWRDSLGQSGVGLAADADHNGTIDVEDYNLWKQLFGSQYDPTAGSSSLATVPEPSSALLLLMAVTSLAVRRRFIFQ
jgi:peroxidase